MDLNELWQAHKTWFLGVLAGIVLFFVADGWIRGRFTTVESRRRIARAKLDLRRTEWYGRDALRAAKAEGEALAQRLAAVERATLYRPRPEYQLEGKGDPSLHYLALTSKVREEVKRGMDASNVDFLAFDLGLPAQSPVDRAEIRRVLIGLDVLEDALQRLLDANEETAALPGFHTGLAAVENLRIQAGRPSRRTPRRAGGEGEAFGGERITAWMKFRADAVTVESFLERLLGGEGQRPLLLSSLSIESVGEEVGEPLLVQCELVALVGEGS